jgi:hypothetical protein
MSKGDWLILCALAIEHEHGFRHAAFFMLRVFRTSEPRLILDPSVFWWAKNYARHMEHFLRENEGIVVKRRGWKYEVFDGEDLYR